MQDKPSKNHFGLKSIQQSLKYFVFGKGSNAFLSIAILFALARFMAEVDYAIFVSWQALVVLLGTVSTFGVQSVTQRFLAELRTNNNQLIYKILGIGISLRLIFALIIAGLLIFFIPFIASALNIPEKQALLSMFLLIGALRVTNLTLAQACDTLLWQRLSQVGLVVTNLFRLGSIYLVHSLQGISLMDVVIIECIAETVYFVYLVLGVRRNRQQDLAGQVNNEPWWAENRERVFRYGGSKYLVSLSRIFYGSGPNRVLAAHFSSLKDVALFGFADNIIRLGRRFMPAVMMVGFIRPIFISRYTGGSGLVPLVKMSNLIFRINLALLVILMTGVLVVGQPVFDFITNGKYGDVYLLVFGFLLLLVFEGLRYILELLIEVTELNSISLVSNLVQSSSFFVAIPLFPIMGLWSIVFANILGTIAACLICVVQLNRNGFELYFETKLISLVLVEGFIIWIVGYTTLEWSSSVLMSIATMAIVTGFLAFFFPPMEKTELNQIRTLISTKKSKAKPML